MWCAWEFAWTVKLVGFFEYWTLTPVVWNSRGGIPDSIMLHTEESCWIFFDLKASSSFCQVHFYVRKCSGMTKIHGDKGPIPACWKWYWWTWKQVFWLIVAFLLLWKRNSRLLVVDLCEIDTCTEMVGLAITGFCVCTQQLPVTQCSFDYRYRYKVLLLLLLYCCCEDDYLCRVSAMMITVIFLVPIMRKSI